MSAHPNGPPANAVTAPLASMCGFARDRAAELSRAKLGAESLCYTRRSSADICEQAMLFSKEYVGYLAREIANKLIEGEFIEAPNKAAVAERIHAALLEELTLEDRINDEVRMILETYSDEMQRSGANYQEMFKKVKNELVRKYKAVL